MDYDLTVLPERLKTLRDELGLTQHQVANILGMKQPVIGRWERGVVTPSLQNAIRLCSVYSVSLDQLCGKDPL